MKLSNYPVVVLIKKRTWKYSFKLHVDGTQTPPTPLVSGKLYSRASDGA